MVFVLIIVGISSHSLGVLAAGGDYVADISALTFGLISISIQNRKGDESKATIVAALINSVGLLVMSLWVLSAGLDRLLRITPEIHGLPVLIVSACAAIVMAVGAFIVGNDDDLHMKSIFLDSLADAVSAAAVALSGAIILIANDWFWLDSLTALIVSSVISYQAIKLLIKAARRLLQPISLSK